MYRTYDSRAMQEQLPRSSTPADSTDLFRFKGQLLGYGDNQSLIKASKKGWLLYLA